jgi:uncharacterized membrane protein YhiD involved in acid resistance
MKETIFDSLLMNSGNDLFSYIDVMLAMALTTLLCLLLSFVYRKTHRGVFYSQSFLIALVLMGVATSVVMMIIGTNIARAFSLVGALSIIRFRTAVKDTRDTAFIFLAIVVGMGIGTKFYGISILLAFFASSFVLAAHHFDFGLKKKSEKFLRVTCHQDVENKVQQFVKERFKTPRLANRVSDIPNSLVTVIFVVEGDESSNFSTEIEKDISAIGDIERVSLYQGDQYIAQ